MKFLSELAVRWLPVDEIRRLKASGTAVARVIEPLRFEYRGRRLFVPAGFVTDHASIPRLFWTIFPPVNPRYGRGAVPHDYGYQFRMFPAEDGGFAFFSRLDIDVLFLKAMEADGADWFTRHAIFRAVRIGGWVAWNKYRKQEKNMVETIKRIQGLVGVAVDGQAGPITWAAIASRLGVEDPGSGLVAQIRAVQSCLCVAVDGIAGAQTWGAIEVAIGALAKLSNSARLLAHARKDIGLKEAPGDASNARIKQAIVGAASWLDPDDSKTAWCGCIMGLWCRELGLPLPKEYFRAASWLTIGEPVDIKNAQPGDIVVISRTGGNHVALFVNSALTLLGGNQANSVSMATFDRSTLRGIRRL